MTNYNIEYKDGSSIQFETKEPISTSFLFEMLVSKSKWYEGFYTKQAAYNIKARHIMQNLTEQFYTELFAKFGYTKNEVVWFPSCEHHISGNKCLKCGRRF